MYKISTFFIKEQLRGLTKADLLDYYRQELQIQGVSRTGIDFSKITFQNSLGTSIFYRSTSRFANFATGTIEIDETGNEFTVLFTANLANIFIAPGLFAAIVTILFLLASGFDTISLLLGAATFVLMLVISYLWTSLTFPNYFTGLRSDIERQIQGQC